MPLRAVKSVRVSHASVRRWSSAAVPLARLTHICVRSSKEMEVLRREVAAYVRDIQEGSLSIGSYSRVQSTYRILRELVLAGDMASNGASSAGGAAGGTSSEELASLRTQITQRDNEISILVNMVRQLKKGGGASGE